VSVHTVFADGIVAVCGELDVQRNDEMKHTDWTAPLRGTKIAYIQNKSPYRHSTFVYV